MKIVVTGGAGFIGSHVVDAYIAAGHTVVVVDDLTTGSRANLHPDARLVEMDIRDPALVDLFAVEQPDILNHHAAHISVHVSVDDPVRDASINILGTLNLLECARRGGVRKIIYASSGGAAYGEPRYLPCDEEHPIDPLSPYGISKHTPEHYCALYQRLYGLAYVVLRYPNVYGPRQDPFGEGGVVAIFSERMLRAQPVTIFGSGAQERDFVAVGDLVRANLAALTRGENEIINCGTGKATTVTDIFAALARITGYDQPPHHAAARPGEVFKIYLTNEKAARTLGWCPEISLREGLESVVASLRLAAR
jgi:UDP-glucose 4-epimerase